ncbi:DUF4214 domain-containing protein [Modestobacter sp. SSW1-42]|uniref:DUF4214 domain-containing protein n=1 Tax=Modestobacter sp. SSW1-42 TaxID=596372 RepID=UPI003987E983
MFRRLLAVALASAAVGVVPVLHATPAQAATASNDQLVQSWYYDFLYREDPASDPGRLYWVDQLDRGVSREYVLGSIVRSTEYASLQIGIDYDVLLGREPDPGANYWIDQTANHDMAWEWVEQNILASPEFYPGGDTTADVEYVRALYYFILDGREPSGSEISYWLRRYWQIGSLNVVREIWYTDEGVRTRLADNYEALLGRGVDGNGLAYWAPRERQSDITVQVALASTDEYAALAAEIFA